MKEESVYFEYDELPTIPQDLTPVDTHLDKQLEYIKQKGILVEEDQLHRMLNQKIYTKAQEEAQEETLYFVDTSYSQGFVVNELGVSWRSKDLIIKGKTKATMFVNKLNLYRDMLLRAYELGYDPDKINNENGVYGIRYDFVPASRGHLYATSHHRLQVFVFGIFFTNKDSCNRLLDEFRERIKMYY
jgi:hypothetical protein